MQIQMMSLLDVLIATRITCVSMANPPLAQNQRLGYVEVERDLVAVLLERRA